jgi:hypothetical protein
VGGGPSQQLHYYCSHDFESLPSEVGEMNEFSVGGNHTHLSTYSTTTAPSSLPTCHLLSVGKCGLPLLGRKERGGNACATATVLPVRDSQQSAQQLFSFAALTNATLCVSFPSFPFRVGRVLDFVDNRRFRFFESSRIRQLRSLAVFLSGIEKLVWVPVIFGCNEPVI